MDTEEYNLITIEYSDDDLKRINEFNKQHIDMAFNILNYNRENLLNNEEYKNLELGKRIQFIQTHEDYKDFCRLYPIVSKYIIAFGLFSKKAFVKFLDWKAKLRPSDKFRSELLNNQREQEKFKNKYIYAVYVKYLYQEKMTHQNLSDINNAYNMTVKDLNEETDHFFDLYDKEMKKQNDKKELSAEEKKQKIINQLKIKLERS